MVELSHFQERLRSQRPVPWEQLPDFALYMDQVLSYMERQVILLDENDALTSAMVNNYTKNGLVPRATGKKYGREHLAYLTAVSILKRVMPAKDIDLLVREALQGRSIEESYADFCTSLDTALAETAQEMEGYTNEEMLADAAIHFALLSYAAGVASRQYVTLLRERTEQTEESAKKNRTEKE